MVRLGLLSPSGHIMMPTGRFNLLRCAANVRLLHCSCPPWIHADQHRNQCIHQCSNLGAAKGDAVSRLVEADELICTLTLSYRGLRAKLEVL